MKFFSTSFCWSYIHILFLSCRSTHSNPLQTREKCILTHIFLLFFLLYITHFAQCCSSLFLQFSFLYYSSIWKFKIKYNKKFKFVFLQGPVTFKKKISSCSNHSVQYNFRLNHMVQFTLLIKIEYLSIHSVHPTGKKDHFTN